LSNAVALDGERELFDALFADYSKEIRPLHDAKQTLVIDLELEISQLKKLVTEIFSYFTFTIPTRMYPSPRSHYKFYENCMHCRCKTEAYTINNLCSKKLSCRRETARCFMSLNMVLTHKFILVFRCNSVCIQGRSWVFVAGWSRGQP